jgi:hypothetical protein
VELLEQRQLLSSTFAIRHSNTAEAKTHPAIATVKTESAHTGRVAFTPRDPVQGDAIVTATPISASRGASELDAGYPLMFVTFGGKGFRPITSDVQPGFPTYRAEQWLGGNDPHQQPVLYAASSALTVSAEWTNTKSTPVTGEILARATTSNGLTIAPTPVKKEAGKFLLARAAAATALFGDDAQFFPHFVIRWQLSFDGGKSWNDAGQSDNPLYVSASMNPLADFFSREFYLTVVDSEINENLGLTAGNQPAIVSNTWSLFAGSAVRQFSPTAPFSDGTEHGRALTYYGTPASASDPTGQQLQGTVGIGYTFNAIVPKLLADGDGQCGAWARLFLDMLLVSGIFETDDYVTVIPQKSEGFLVNNWNFIGGGKSGNPNYPYLDEPGKPYEVTKQPGLPGQNSPDPLSVFGNHVIARIDGTYYDPSYGETYANLRQMTAKDVAGYFKMVPGKSDAFEIQKAAASGELLKVEMYFTWKPPGAS